MVFCAKLLDEIARNPDTYWHEAELLSPGHIPDYVAAMASRNAWGGHVEMRAYCTVFQRSLLVYGMSRCTGMYQFETCYNPVVGEALKTFMLAYVGANHYDSIWPAQEDRHINLPFPFYQISLPPHRSNIPFPLFLNQRSPALALGAPQALEASRKQKPKASCEQGRGREAQDGIRLVWAHPLQERGGAQEQAVPGSQQACGRPLCHFVWNIPFLVFLLFVLTCP